MNQCSDLISWAKSNQEEGNETLPEPLIKSTEDPFVYAIGLRDGSVIVYDSAEIKGEWIHLSIEEGPGGPESRTGFFQTIRGSIKKKDLVLGRGVSVRISDIMWVADAPFGS